MIKVIVNLLIETRLYLIIRFTKFALLKSFDLICNDVDVVD